MSDIDELIDMISDRMQDNGAEFVFEVDSNPDATLGLAFGFILRNNAGGFMSGEIGLDARGQPQLVVSSYGPTGELAEPTVIALDGSMIITP